MIPRLSDRSTEVRSSQIRDLLRLTQQGDILSLAGGLPAREALPTDRVAEAADRIFSRAATGLNALQYGPTEGDADLRELLADRAGVTVDEVLVTTGSQQAIGLVAHVLADRGQLVATSDPTYLGAIQAFCYSGLTLRGVQQGVESWSRAFGTSRTGRTGAALGYVVPDFDNPTGTRWSIEDRRALAELAAECGVTLIEDRPYSELAFDDASPPPMSTFSADIVRIGTSSKVIAPGLRVGWIIGPREVIAAATRVKQCLDLHTSSFDQAIVADLLVDGRWCAAQIAMLRSLYSERARSLATSLRRHLGDRFTFDEPLGGMFIWGRFDEGHDARRVLHAALAEGVAFVPGAEFAVDDAGRLRPWARLSFAGLGPDELDEAALRLGRAIEPFR